MTDLHATAAELPPRDHNSPPSLLDAESLLRTFGSETEPGQYTELAQSVTALLANIRETAPERVETSQQNGIIAAHMNALRDTIKIVDNHREAEKAPYLKAERAAQNYFSAFLARLEKTRGILQARGDEYTRRVVAEEKAERNRIAAAAAKAADDARREAARLAQEEADKKAAAERARKQENIDKLTAEAEQVGGQAAIAQVDQMIATSTAENAMLAAHASSADIARTRHDSGHLSTAKQAPHVEIVDKELLDLRALLPFIKEDALLAALKAWAKVTNHKKPMDGAIIEMRDRADYR